MKPTLNMINDNSSDLILSIDNEKSERITEDFKLKMAILKESKSIEAIDSSINDKFSNFVINIGNQIEELKKNYKNEMNSNIFGLSKQLNDLSSFVQKNFTDNPLKLDIPEKKDDLSLAKDEINDMRNKLIIEQKKLDENKELEAEIVSEIVNNNNKNLNSVISNIQKDIFANEQTIVYLTNLIEEKKNKLSISEESNKIITDINLGSNFDSNLKNFKIIEEKYIEIKNKFEKSIDNLSEKKLFTKNILSSFNNIELSDENSKKLEQIRDKYEAIILEFNLDSLFVKNKFNELEVLIEEVNKMNPEDSDFLVSKSLDIIKSNTQEINSLILKTTNFFNDSEKLDSEIKKINYNLENLFEGVIKSNLNNKETKTNSDIKKEIIDEVKNEFYNIIKNNSNSNINNVNNFNLNNKSNLENTNKFIIEDFQVDKKDTIKKEKVKVNLSESYPVFILNCDKVNDVMNINLESLDKINEENFDKSTLNSDDFLDKKLKIEPKIQDLKFVDYLDGIKINESIIGKVIKYKSFYDNIEIKGQGLQSVDLCYNNSKVSIRTMIKKLFVFESIKIISEEEARLIVSNIYGVEDFELEFCYFTPKSSNFIIPAYHIIFNSGDFVETFFPANLNYLPKLSISNISIMNVTGKVNKFEDSIDDPDNIGNEFDRKEKYISFKLKLDDLSYTGDDISVFSSYRIENIISNKNEINISIPNVLSKQKYNNISKIDLVISCKNKFGFVNCLKLHLDLSKYSKMFQIEKSINHGGNRHNFAINNFDPITGSEIFNKFRNDMTISGIKEEYCDFIPATVNGNADLIINIAGTKNLSDLIDNLDDVEHMVNMGMTKLNYENLKDIFNKKVHLICGFEKNIAITDNLSNFYRKCYEEGIPIVNSWILSSIMSDSTENNPFVAGPLIENRGKKYNSLVSSNESLHRAFIQDSVWGTVPGPGVDLHNTKINGFWKLIIE